MSRGWTFGLILWLVLPGLACNKDTDSSATAPKPEAPKLEKLGADLAGAPEVKVEDLLKDPAAYEGKIVRVSGVVKDMCTHRRAWFGVDAADGSGILQVFAVPRFQAPQNAIGRKVVTEGKVELATLTEEQAQYYVKGHKFIKPEQLKPGQGLTIANLRAFGAEFN
jgi:hypothetical protein